MTMPQTRHYEMKDSGVEWIGKMPRHWNTLRLQKIYRIKKDIAGTAGHTVLSVTQHGIKPKNMDSKGQFALDYSKYQLVKSGDFVMNHMDLLTGWVDISKYDGVTSPDYRVFTSIANCQNTFFKYIFQFCYMNRVFYGLGQGVADVGRWRLPADMFRKFMLPVPPLSEQAAIAAYLDEKCTTIDAIITEAKASIEEYRSWKASVIFETVTKGLNPNAEMKDSGVEWIGEMPRAWSAKRIKTLALSSRSLFIDGDWINSPDISEAGIRYFTTGNVGQGYFKEQGNGYITTETFNRLNCTMVHAGDLIISRLNEPIGRACIIPEHYKDCIVAVDNVILRPDDGYNKKYLMYCMSSDRYAEYTALLARGTTMHRISRTQLGNIFLPIPPSSEQAFIVSYLDEKCAAIDGIIAEKEALIGELETYKKSLIFEAVTGKRRVC